MEPTYEQIKKRYQLLPKSLQNLFFSELTSDAIKKACVLREAESHSPTIAELVGHVLLGYLRPELFASEIQKETGVEELKAQHIAHDIDSEIFSEVRLELKKLYPPTILTPNVQTQGFSREYVSATPAPVAKPKYVIQIPEKFQNKSFPGIIPTPVKQETPTTPPEPVVIQKPAEPNQVTIQQTAEPIIQDTKPQTEPTLPIQQEIKNPETKNVLVEKKFEVAKTEAPQTNIHTTQNQTEAQPKQTPSAPKIGERPTQPTVKIAQTVEPSGVKIDPVVPLPTFIGSRFQQSMEVTSKDSEEKIKEMASKFVTSSTAQPKPPQESAYKEKLDTAKKQGMVDLSKF